MSAAEGVTLAGFLAARLDEDEAASAAGASTRLALSVRRVTRYPDTASRRALTMMGRHDDPARVLREVEAKRKILAEHRIDPELLPGVCYRCRYGVPAHWESADWPCPTLRALAAPYSDHPDYDPGWAA